jgi:hypothetical protein
MQTYIGTKMIRAKAMTRGDYNKLRGWSIPADENPNDEGYLVEYLDGGEANHKDYDGYISWSPKGVFERAYRLVTGMTFGAAIEAMKHGKKVARVGWNGKGMWIGMVKADNYVICTAPHGDGEDTPEGECNGLLPWIGMKTADNKFVPWLASQSDMLCEDWMVVE